MKSAIVIIIVALLGLGAFVFMGSEGANEEVVVENEEAMEEVVEAAVSNGEYEIVVEDSVLNWAGKKPLIDGYINSGVLKLTEGSITISDESSTGNFEIDMNTLQVGETKAKPGAEEALEGHLKGDRWFNVEEFPTASVSINTIENAGDLEDEYLFNVMGELTMKGETGEISFPARIYTGDDGRVRADASFEIDRTLWGITSGSGSFFDDLADNVIDDMVALSFSLVAEPKAEKTTEDVMEEDVMEEEVVEE